MGKKILVISTSYRKGGNSDTLADEFINGAIEAGHETEKVTFSDINMKFCIGCLVCQQTKQCVIQDDVKGILEKMIQKDVIVFATPIYYYEMSGQMKTFLDRTNPLFTSDYRFRDIYFLAAAADAESSAVNGALKGLEGWVTCFEKTKIAGTVFGGSTVMIGDIHKNDEILKSAYEMGRNA